MEVSTIINGAVKMLAFVLISYISFYLLFGLFSLDFNILSWSDDKRVGHSLLTILSSLFLIISSVVNEN